MNQNVDRTDTAVDERVRTVMSALSQGLSGELPLNDHQLREVGQALNALERDGVINPVEKGALWKAVNWSDDIAPFLAAKDSGRAELYRTAILEELRQIESPALRSSPQMAGAKKRLEDDIPDLIKPVAEERFRDAQAGFADALGAIGRGDLSGADARRDQVTLALEDSLRYPGGEAGLVKMTLAAAALASDPGKGNEAYHAYAHLLDLQATIDDHDARHPGRRLLTAQNRELLESVEADIVKRLGIQVKGGNIVLPDGSLLPVGSGKAMSIDPVDGSYGFASNQLKPYQALLSEMDYLRDSFAQRGGVSLGAGPVRHGAAVGIIEKTEQLRTLVDEGNLGRIAQFVKENGLQTWKDKPGSLREEADRLTTLDAWHNRFFKNAHAVMEATGFVPAVAAAKIMENIIQGQRKGLSDGEITKNFAVDLVSELGVKKLTGKAETMGGKAMAEFTRNVATEFLKEPTSEGMAKALGNSFYKAVTGTIAKDALKTMSPEQAGQLRDFLVDAASKLGATNLVKPYLESVFPRAGRDTPDSTQKSRVDGDGVMPSLPAAALDKAAGDAIDKSGALRGTAFAGSRGNVSAALALMAAQNNLDGIDSVMISKDGTRLIAVQGDPRSEFYKTATITLQEAARQPADQSLAQIAPSQVGTNANPAARQADVVTTAAPQSDGEPRSGVKLA